MLRPEPTPEMLEAQAEKAQAEAEAARARANKIAQELAQRTLAKANSRAATLSYLENIVNRSLTLGVDIAPDVMKLYLSKKPEGTVKRLFLEMAYDAMTHPVHGLQRVNGSFYFQGKTYESIGDVRKAVEGYLGVSHKEVGYSFDSLVFSIFTTEARDGAQRRLNLDKAETFDEPVMLPPEIIDEDMTDLRNAFGLKDELEEDLEAMG